MTSVNLSGSVFAGVFHRKFWSDISESLFADVFSRKHYGVTSVNHSGSLCLLVFLVENTAV